MAEEQCLFLKKACWHTQVPAEQIIPGKVKHSQTDLGPENSMGKKVDIRSQIVTSPTSEHNQ